MESWVAVNRPEDIVIVHADAYDAKGKRVKQFIPTKVRKVNGAWELAEMKIRNLQTGSSTRIEFQARATTLGGASRPAPSTCLTPPGGGLRSKHIIGEPVARVHVTAESARI